MRRQRHATSRRALTQNRARRSHANPRGAVSRLRKFSSRLSHAPGSHRQSFLLSVSLPRAITKTTHVIDVSHRPGRKDEREENERLKSDPPEGTCCSSVSPLFSLLRLPFFHLPPRRFRGKKFCGDHLQFKYIDAPHTHSRTRANFFISSLPLPLLPPASFMRT